MAKLKLLEAYKWFDIFGKGVQFNVSGNETVTSCVGATVSILVAFVTIAYAWTRFDVLMKFGDTTYQDTLDYRDDIESEVYDQADTNFMIAFGLK